MQEKIHHSLAHEIDFFFKENHPEFAKITEHSLHSLVFSFVDSVVNSMRVSVSELVFKKVPT